MLSVSYYSHRKDDIVKLFIGSILLLTLTACGDNGSTPTKAAHSQSAAQPEQSGQTATAETGSRCDVSGDYQINFQRMDETLQQIAHASGCFVEADLQTIGALKPNPVEGHFSVKQAVDTAIAGTGLQAQLTEHNIIQVTQSK